MQSTTDIGRLFASGAVITVRGFGEFLSEGLVGAGDVGSVYRLTRRGEYGDGKSYAVKVVDRSIWSDDRRMAQLSNACSAIACVRHPSVCGIEGLFYALPAAAPKPGVPVVFMPYLRGVSLRQCFDVAVTDLTPVARYQIANQLMGGLGALHKAGVVHRDIRPETVLLTDPGDRSRVIEIVQFSDAHVLTDSTPAARLNGVATHLSPAQCAGEAPTVADDIYSLSVTLYELFSGRRVFPEIDSNDRSALHDAHTTTLPTPLRDLAPELPADVAHEIESGLSKNPRDRPPTADTYAAPFRRMARRLLREESTGALAELLAP